MEIRPDLPGIQPQLARLVQIANAFHEFNMEHWSHRRNQEDYDQIFRLPNELRDPFEELYRTGRDIAVAFSQSLSSIERVSDAPTITSYVRQFEAGWLHEFPQLTQVRDSAERASKTIAHSPWAVEEMIKLYTKQLVLLTNVKDTLKEIKNSDLYRRELNLPPLEIPWYRTFDKRMVAIMAVIGIIGLWLTYRQIT